LSTLTQARDAVLGMLRTGLLASPTTSALPVVWDDVEGDRPGHNAAGNPQSYLRAVVRHLASATETIGRGPGVGKEEHNATCVVQVFTPRGTGYGDGDTIAQIVKRIFQRQRIPGVDGWFFEVTAAEVPAVGPWAQINVSAPFRYTEVVA
jgi:hypothetical protein